jgi:predicted transcriptional regulator
MKTPCEIFVWYLLPGVRRELARHMIKDFKISQTKTAVKLGVTDAAISQYLSKKRGALSFNEDLKKEIGISAERIVKGDDKTTVEELCRICNVVKNSGLMIELYKKHTGASLLDCDFLLK